MSYTAPVYLLQPGQRETIPVVGREVVVIEADKDFLIATNSGEPQFITAGLQLAPDGGFENIVMRNPHAEAISVRLGITDGAIKDNRASVSTVLPVRDPGDLSSFSDVIAALADVEASQAAILAMMQNASDQRAALHEVGGSSIAGIPTVAPVKIIDPVLNTNGAVLRRFSFYSGSYTSLHCDTAAPTGYADLSKRRIISVYDPASGSQLTNVPLHIPAGNGLWFSVSVAGGVFSAGWDYLP